MTIGWKTYQECRKYKVCFLGGGGHSLLSLPIRGSAHIITAKRRKLPRCCARSSCGRSSFAHVTESPLARAVDGDVEQASHNSNVLLKVCAHELVKPERDRYQV